MSEDTVIPATQSDYEARKQRVMRIASVRSRNAGLDLIAIKNADPNKHYEWVRNNEVSILKKKNLGFVFAPPEMALQVHGDGTKTVVGDVVLMECSMENKEDIEFADRLEYERRHGKHKDGEIVGLSEENEFDALVKNAGLTLVDEGHTRSIDGSEVQSTLESILDEGS